MIQKRVLNRSLTRTLRFDKMSNEEREEIFKETRVQLGRVMLDAAEPLNAEGFQASPTEDPILETFWYGPHHPVTLNRPQVEPHNAHLMVMRLTQKFYRAVIEDGQSDQG